MAGWNDKRLRALLEGGEAVPSLNGANLVDQDLTGLDLGRADLTHAFLSGADLSGASLRGAMLFGAKAAGACLRQADLRNANLTAADFARSDLTGARLEGADVTGTNLSAAWGVDADVGDLAARGAIVRPDPTVETRLDERADPATVSLMIGQVVRIGLADPSGGYRWTVVDDFPAAMDAAEPMRGHHRTVSSEGVRPVGEDNPVTFRFRARRAGEGVIRLVLARSWEHGKGLRELAVQVRILPSSAPERSHPDPDGRGLR